MKMFTDRFDAGRQLAAALDIYSGEHTVIYALARGGVVLGYEIARTLKAPLDIILTRKIAHPDMPEYAVCAVSELNDLICHTGSEQLFEEDWFAQVIEKEKLEIRRRREAYAPDFAISAENKIAILVDDGIATGLTMRAAIAAIKQQNPLELVLATPVAPASVLEPLRSEVTHVVALHEEHGIFRSVSDYYDDFPQLPDQEIVRILESANRQN